MWTTRGRAYDEKWRYMEGRRTSGDWHGLRVNRAVTLLVTSRMKLKCTSDVHKRTSDILMQCSFKCTSGVLWMYIRWTWDNPRKGWSICLPLHTTPLCNVPRPPLHNPKFRQCEGVNTRDVKTQQRRCTPSITFGKCWSLTWYLWLELRFYILCILTKILERFDWA